MNTDSINSFNFSHTGGSTRLYCTLLCLHSIYNIWNTHCHIYVIQKYPIATYVLKSADLQSSPEGKRNIFFLPLNELWCRPLRESETDRAWLFWKVIGNLFLTYRRMYARVLLCLIPLISWENLFSSSTDKSAQYWCLRYLNLTLLSRSLCVQLPLIANLLSNCHNYKLECCSILQPWATCCYSVFDRHLAAVTMLMDFQRSEEKRFVKPKTNYCCWKLPSSLLADLNM